MKKEKRLTLMLDEKIFKWIRSQEDMGEFDNQSAGIRKCILIAKRVYEQGSPEEIVKFVHGKDIDAK